MSTTFKLLLTVVGLLVTQCLEAQSQALSSFDACEYPTNIPPDQIFYYGSWHSQASTISSVTNIYDSFSWGTTNDVEPDYEALQYELAIHFGYSCGSYYGSCYITDSPLDSTCAGLDLAADVNAYLNGTLDTGSMITENHSATSYDVTEVSSDGLTTVNVSSQLLDPYIMSLNINDGEDNGTNDPCPTNDPSDSPNLTVGDSVDDDYAGGDGDNPNYTGMPRWFISEPYLNLWVKDCPVEYTTSLGKKIRFQIASKQRDTRPLNTGVPPTGWSHNWFSYVHVVFPYYFYANYGSDAAFPSLPVLPGPAAPQPGWACYSDSSQWQAILYSTENDEHYFAYNNQTEAKSSLTLTPIFQDIGGVLPWVTPFELVHPDGSVDEYTIPAAAPQTFSYGLATSRGRTYDQGSVSPKLFNLGNGTFYQTSGGGSGDSGGGSGDGSGGTSVNTYLYDPTDSPPIEGTQIGYIAADALLTKRTDRYGNSITLNYRALGTNVDGYMTNFVLQSMTDYDGQTTTFAYDGNGMLTNVAMPYGRSASFVYTAGQMTGITDAQGMSSSFAYTAFPYMDLSGPATNIYLSSLTTPYGQTTFAHYEAPPVLVFTNPPSLQKVSGPGSDTVVEFVGTTPLYVGWEGGTNRVNKACTVTYPDGTHELYMYRYDSRGLVPTSYPSGETPNSDAFGPVDDGLDANGVDPLASTDHLLSSRNSFHWNRQQYPLLSTTDILALGSNDYSVATMKHWLQNNVTQTIYPNTPEHNVSDQMSLIRAASPDGVRAGAKTWVFHNGEMEFEAGDYSGDTTICLLPNGDARYNTKSYSEGVLQSITASYTAIGGSTSTRTLEYVYDSAPSVYDSLGDGYAYFPRLADISSPIGDITWDYSTDGSTMTKTDSEGNSATYFYNSRHQLTGIVHADGLVTTNFYGSSGFLAQSIDLQSRATNTFTFANGLPAAVVTPAGLQLNFSWDNLSRLTQIAFPDGTTLSNSYNRLDVVARKDRLNHWTYAAYDTMDEPYSSTDANGGVTQYSYCFCGGLSSITDPLGNTTAFTRDYDGRVTAVSGSDGFSTTYGRNYLGQVTNAITSAGLNLNYYYNNQGLVTNVTSGAASLASVIYDDGDLPYQVTDAQGVTETNNFDSLGRLINSYDAFGRQQNVYSSCGLYQHYDALRNFTTYGYDPAGRLAATTDANGNTNGLTYTSSGRLAALADGNGHVTAWTWDQYGRRLTKTDGNGVLVETNGYNANGWLTAHWTPAMGLTHYTYDNNGNRLTTAYSSGTTISITYDGLNRVTALGDAVGASTFTYANFAAFQGALATQSGPFGSDTVTHAYSDRVPQSLTLAQPAGSWTESFGFDSLLRLQSLGSPAGTFGYSYYGAGKEIQTLSLPGGSAINETYGGAGQLLGTTFQNGSTVLDAYAYTYDKNGRRTAVQRADNATVNYGYDYLGQLTSAVGYDPDGTTQRANENLTYSYDPAGNLAGRQNNTLIQSFQTDNANELVNVTRDNNVLTVAGSLSNNVTGLAVNGQSATIYHDLTYAVAGGVALANQVNQFTGVVSIGSVTLTNRLATELPVTVNLRYDANGNLLWDGLTAYTYDCANELATATVTNCWKTTYAYDGFGRRRLRQEYAWISRAWVETNEVRYVYDGRTVLQERDSNNVPLVTYTRGVDFSGSLNGAGGIGGLLARTDANGSAYYHADGNGNITALVDGSGTLVAKYLYDSFGNPLGMWGSLAAANTYRFSSKEMDLRSGLYYFGYRDYAPNLQRWPNRDPIEEHGGINLYDYVNNDPINLFDPLGLWNADRQEELDSRQSPKSNLGPSPRMMCSSHSLLDMPPATARALASQFALGLTAAASLYNTWDHNVNNLPHDPNAVFYVPMGFGFGTVSYYDSTDDSFVNLPAMMMGDTPILLTPSELDIFAQEAQSRIQRTGIPVGPGAPPRRLD